VSCVDLKIKLGTLQQKFYRTDVIQLPVDSTGALTDDCVDLKLVLLHSFS